MSEFYDFVAPLICFLLVLLIVVFLVIALS